MSNYRSSILDALNKYVLMIDEWVELNAEITSARVFSQPIDRNVLLFEVMDNYENSMTFAKIFNGILDDPFSKTKGRSYENLAYKFISDCLLERK